MADMVEANQALEERLDKQGNKLYNLENLDIPHKVSKAVDEIVTDAVDWVIQAPLKDRFRDFPEADMKEILHHPDVIYLQYQMEECHKLLTDQVDDAILRYNVSKPLALGGPQGQVTIQTEFFFNKDFEYLRYGSKGSRPALSISKIKAAYYPDLGLEQMVPDQMWIEEECKYDVAVMYDISHWWFQRQQFYIDRHTSKGDRRGVRTHMRILSVVRIKVFSLMVTALYNRLMRHWTTGSRNWSTKDVDRSKEFMFAIQKRLKTRRIFRNLESFVGGRVRERDYRLL
ncbi:hypothetical protein Tco_1340056 [Tanacetum coccineum]